MHGKIFTYPFLVKEVYLDTFGHMNNAVYLTLFEEARWAFITQNGYGLEKIMSTGIGPTILDIKIRFLKELRLRDQITIESQVVSYEKKIGLINQHMLRGDELCCTAVFTIALFDLNQRKLINPTQDWLAAIGFA